MYLKRLELHGFKSFAKKTILEFNNGINGVVGPNGSGKSNISDAITWVLGEQSSKTLRGTKMDDVIFNGTEHRRAMSYAEVSLVLDNENREIDSEYNEVYITRKIYRNGDTDYLINNKSCRLKDIYELFMDTGIGKDGYSIIGQGKIDKIINSKPEERRGIFEEAVGIVKYRTRKIEAIAKLKKEKEHLDRVTDIISEIENQLLPLEKQSEVAKTYLNYEDRLRVVSISAFKKTLEDSDKLIKQFETDIINHKKDIEKQNIEIESYQKILKDLERQQFDVTEEVKSHTVEISDVKVSIEKEKNNINLAQEKIKNAQSNIVRIKNEISNLKSNILQNEKEIQNIDKKVYDNKLLVTKNNSKLFAFSTERNLLVSQFGKNQEKNNDIEAQINDNIDSISRINLALSEKKSRLENLEEKIQTMNSDSVHKKSELETIISELEKLELENNNLQVDLLNLKETIGSTKATVQSKNNQLENLKREYNELDRSLNKNKDKLNLLNGLESENQGFYESVRYVLKNKSDIDDELEVVANILKVPKNLETALEIALGGSVNYIVTKNTTTASIGIDLLKKNKRGRVTFLPLDRVKSRYIKSNFVNEGVLGIASDLVSFDETYKNVVENLLGNVLVVDTLENAIAINKENKTHRIVTLEGDVLNTSGFMTGGSVKQNGAKIFSRKREIIECSEQISDLQKQVKFISEDISIVSAELTAVTKKLEEESSLLNEKNYLEVELKNKGLLLNSKKEPLVQFFSKEDDLEKHILQSVTLKNEIEKLENSYQDLLVIQNNLKAEKDSFSNDVGDLQTRRDELTELINNTKLEIANLQNTNNHAEIQKENYLEDIEKITTKISLCNSEIEQLNFEVLDIQSDIKGYLDLIEKLKVDIINLDEVILYKNNELTKINEKSSETSLLVEKIKEQCSKTEKDMYTLELKQNQVNERITEKYDELWQKYEMSHNDILEYDTIDETLDSLKREERDLTQKIRNLGSVNVNAIEQFQETNNRYQFLVSQKEDIIKSEEQLLEIIDELSSQMEIQFRKEFEIINTNFTKTFTELFNGGYAKLQLTNTDNIMETGVEIIAEPPGKKLKNLMLLSGGEKAMTAIALLFAILKYKPSPFSLLDEIDSALDDANVDRYADFLSKHSKDTQFIVITHRKGTMERAEILYGVTMQEQGVSTLVSAEF